MTRAVESFVEGRWLAGHGGLRPIRSAITGTVIAEAGHDGLDFSAMRRFARMQGGPALRRMTFHERARMLKTLADALLAQKESLYDLSAHTGATRADSWIDIEGGAGTFLAYASKGRRELPNATLLLDGAPEPIGRGGGFVAQHILSPRQGVSVQINAYNFPVWGMLEKLAQTLLAGVPAIVKPATATAQVAEAAMRILAASGALPAGSVQFVSGDIGDLLDHLDGQDSVLFTGSAETAARLWAHPTIAREAVRFNAERDSLNACILGPDAAPGTIEHDLFLAEVVKEMTVKAGQKCTAIRRILVPAGWMDAVADSLAGRLKGLVPSDPRASDCRLGALVNASQRDSVRAAVGRLTGAAEICWHDPQAQARVDAHFPAGGFMAPVLLRTDQPWSAREAHEVEPFGPVATIMPYRDVEDAAALAREGKGSLVMSVFTNDRDATAQLLEDAAAYHGRILIQDRHGARDSTGHGSPLPSLVHGGPGRAGGGEEMGGLRGVVHHMQRSAVQGSPAMLSGLLGQQMPGAPVSDPGVHPFRLRFGEIEPGASFLSDLRIVTLADIEHFAHFTGDTFYAHMDEEAARASPIFGGRVAHGYLILSFAAGLFVDPAPGPVLANYGLENLRFVKPLKPGDSMRARLTAHSKSLRSETMGEVRWSVLVSNQADETVASYELLTMNSV
jgi:oxepin-CoA hydrolase/3-oxo-5,6-dehydrosuberyl-CoA semialdehyde dehydrogenase